MNSAIKMVISGLQKPNIQNEKLRNSAVETAKKIKLTKDANIGNTSHKFS